MNLSGSGVVAIRIRAQRPDDAPAVHRVITEAFTDHGQTADLAASLRARPDLQASLVAEDGNRIVAHTQLSISWVDDPHRLIQVLTLGPLSVAPGRQREGIGGRLLAEATRTAEDLEVPLLFLEGDPGYYSKHGWLPASEHGFTAPSNRIPGEAFQVKLLAGYEPATMNGALIYNDTFWSHDSVGLRASRDGR